MKKDRVRFLFSVSLMAIFFSFANQAFALSAISSSSSSSISASGGNSSWSDANSANNSDDLYSTNTLSSSEDPENQNTNNLKATGFNFTIPENAHIDGIIVEVEKHASIDTDNGNTKDLSVKLTKETNPTGTENKADSATYWGISDSMYSYGGSDDLWGDTWTAGDINSPEFGVLFGARLHAQATTVTASVDSFKITVYYTLPYLNSITINTASTEITVPATLQFTSILLDQFNNPFTETATWSSSDSNIATVDASGLVTGISSGNVAISAKNGSIISNTIELTIKPKPKKSSGGGGGGSAPRALLIPQAQNPTVTPPGQVLGVETFLFTLDLKIGSRGNEVAELQKKLTKDGVYIGPVTSYFGPMTFASVKAFQLKYGLPAVGKVGPLTRNKLNSLN